MSLADRLARSWYAPRPDAVSIALAPLAWLFGVGVRARRFLYRRGVLRSHRVAVPVVVVGNLTVGGTGKTPLVIALARALAAHGRHPGVVSRGHGRRRGSVAPIVVAPNDDAAQVGDEPLLFARAGIPVAVALDRVAAATALLSAYPQCDVILADDGLQHERLARDFEIAVIDGQRGLGNGWLLPAGPLREPASRQDRVDAVVVNGDGAASPYRHAGAFRMHLEGRTLHRVNAPSISAPPSEFAGTGVVAVAGIGNPPRFFASLRALGIEAAGHAFPDHHRFAAGDLRFPGASSILMTEKDAVKCTAFADDRCWYLPVVGVIDPALVARVLERIDGPQAA